MKFTIHWNSNWTRSSKCAHVAYTEYKSGDKRGGIEQKCYDCGATRSGSWEEVDKFKEKK